MADFEGSIYMRATLEGKPLFIDDLAAYPDRTDIEEGMLEHGVRNIVVAPLLYQDQTIGSLSLSSPHPGDLNALQAPKLQEILPLFSMAVKRSMDELENRIQALIKEKCTAIHPVVEWRFRQAVLDSIESPSGPDGRRDGDGGDRLPGRVPVLRASPTSGARPPSAPGPSRPTS